MTLKQLLADLSTALTLIAFFGTLLFWAGVAGSAL